MEFKNKTVIVTGGAIGIGANISEEFKKLGANVCIIDIKDNDYFIGDLSKKEDIEEFVKKVLAEYGSVDYLINNAKPKTSGLNTSTYEDFLDSLKVGVAAPFYLVQLLKDHFIQ